MPVPEHRSAAVAAMLAVRHRGRAGRPRPARGLGLAPATYAAAEGGFRTEAILAGGIRAAISATGTPSAISTVTVGSQFPGRSPRCWSISTAASPGGKYAGAHRPQHLRGAGTGNAQIASARATGAGTGHAAHQRGADYARKATSAASSWWRRADVDLSSRHSTRRARRLVRLAASIHQQTASLKEQVNIDRAVIRSPVDGVVLTRNMSHRPWLRACRRRSYFNIAEDLSKIQIELAVDAIRHSQVKAGQAVVAFSADAFSGPPVRAWSKQCPAATTVNNVVTHPVV